MFSGHGGLLVSIAILVTFPAAICCPAPPCTSTVNARAIKVPESGLEANLVLYAAALTQDPVQGNFLVAVVLFTMMVAVAMYAAVVQRWEERSSKSQVSTHSGLKGIDERQFTPDLVVPEGCECILLVCSKPKRGMTYDVVDSGGGVVLRMEDTDATPLPRRKLLTTSKVLLGQCVRSQGSFPSTSSEITFEILNANHVVFAKLTYEPRQGRDDKVFIETAGQKFLFCGSIQHQTLNLTDFCGRLLATTEPVTQQGPRGEPPGSLLRLRVAPLADVGLVLCSLMCIQHISPGW